MSKSKTRTRSIVFITALLIGALVSFFVLNGGVKGYVNAEEVLKISGEGGFLKIKLGEPIMVSIEYTDEQERLGTVHVEISDISVVKADVEKAKISATPNLSTRLGPFWKPYVARSATLFVSSEEEKQEWTEFLEEIHLHQYSVKGTFTVGK